MILVWIAIAQKLISASLLNADSKQGRGGTQQQQRTPIVDGFEVKNYLATSQKVFVFKEHEMRGDFNGIILGHICGNLHTFQGCGQTL